MHNIIRESLSLRLRGGDFSKQRLCISAIVGKRPSADTDIDTDIFLDGFYISGIFEKAGGCCGVHGDDLIRGRINWGKCKVHTCQLVSYYTLWQISKGKQLTGSEHLAVN